MGIYRTLLEEEVPHLDDNNNPDEQIKELIDTIEDQDANEAEQDRAQEAEFAEPGTSADELLGESWMAIYEMASGMNTIMQALAVHELNEAANGREFLMEGPDIKGFFKSVKDKVVAFFKKVWSVIQRWAGNLRAAITSGKKFAEKYASQMTTGYNIMKADKTRKDMKGYEFSGLVEAENIASSSKDFAVDALKSKFGDDLSGNSNVSAEDAEALVDTVRGKFCGPNAGSVSAADYAKKLKEHLYGDSEPKAMLMDVDGNNGVIATLKSKKDDLKTVNDFMKESKKQMKSVLDTLNKAERKAGTAEKDETKDATHNRMSRQTQLTRAINCMRQMLSVTQAWRSQTLGAIRARYVQARRYGMAYVAAANRDKHKGFRKESTEYGFLGNLGLV